MTATGVEELLEIFEEQENDLVCDRRHGAFRGDKQPCGNPADFWVEFDCGYEALRCAVCVHTVEKACYVMRCPACGGTGPYAQVVPIR